MELPEERREGALKCHLKPGERRQRAQERQVVRNSRTVEEQVAFIQKRPGESRRERARLEKLIRTKNQPAATTDQPFTKELKQEADRVHTIQKDQRTVEGTIAHYTSVAKQK